VTVDHYSPARTMADAVRTRQMSARELLELHLDRIARVNPDVNALVSIDPERARQQAAAADEALARGAEVGPLHGLPFAVKDVHHVLDWRTTFGSPVMADHFSTFDSLVVERVRAAGAVLVAKTNVPEWAAGSHTFNPIFGTTRNPYDLTRAAGGSSGGSAAGLATGMVPLADGSDMGGSLRNPASFCNVVGLRPSVGRVPVWPTWNYWETLSVDGPMARDVADLALLLSVLAGPTDRSPAALATPGSVFAAPLHGDLAGVRVAWAPDLGGAIEVDSEVAAVVAAQCAVLEDAGARVEAIAPDLSGASETFQVLRAWLFHYTLSDLLADHPDDFKATLADNIRAGEPLTGHDVAVAHARRTELGDRMRLFFADHDVLALPVSQVPPFPADQEFPAEINGRRQETYLDWMRSCFLISVTGCPAVSVPAGFTPGGLPVGLQLVGPVGGERRLLEIAAAYEQLNPVGLRRPPL
jgi:amidase